jgi:hypothetical protein
MRKRRPSPSRIRRVLSSVVGAIENGRRQQASVLGYDMEAVETFLRDFRNDDIAALSHKVELLAQPGAQLAKVEVTLSDGTMRTAERTGAAPALDAGGGGRAGRTGGRRGRPCARAGKIGRRRIVGNKTNRLSRYCDAGPDETPLWFLANERGNFRHQR